MMRSVRFAAAVAAVILVSTPPVLAGSNNGQLFGAFNTRTSSNGVNISRYANNTGNSSGEFNMPFAIRVTNGYVWCSVAPSATVDVSLRTNGSDSALCTIPSSDPANCSLTGLATDFAVGDTLATSEVNSVSVSRECRVTFSYTANGGSTPADAIIGGGDLSHTYVAGTTYNCGGWGLTGATPGNDWSCFGTTSANAAMLIPDSCTLSGFSVETSAVLPALVTEAYTVITRTGTATDTSTDLTATLNSSTAKATDTSCTTGCTLAQGDRVYVQSIAGALGVPAARQRHWGISCNGIGQIVTQTCANAPNNTTAFSGPMYCNAANTFTAAQPVAANSIAKNLTVLVDNALDHTITVTLDSGTDPTAMTTSAMTCTTGTSAGTTCTDNNNSVTINAGSYFAMRVKGNGTANSDIIERMPDVARQLRQNNLRNFEPRRDAYHGYADDEHKQQVDNQ